MDGEPQAARQVVGTTPLQQGAVALHACFQRHPEIGAQLRYPPLQLVAGGGHYLRGRGRGGGAMVGGQVAEGAVHLVAYRGDHGSRGGGDRAHYPFIGERQQVFQRAAAAGDDDHLTEAPAIGGTHATGDARGSVGPLHRSRQNHHVDPGVAAPQYAHQVAHRGAGGRGDHRHPARQQRQRLLAGPVEQALRGQGALALLQDRQQVTFAGAFDAVRDELVAAARAIYRYGSAHPHQHAVGRDEGEQEVAILEQDHAQRRLPVHQVEVVVAGAGRPKPADLAFHHHVAELTFQQSADAAG